MSHIKGQGISGVVTFSTGNHGLSVATPAKLFDIPAIVVVPKGANPAKIQLIRGTGAEVVEAGKTFDEAALAVNEISQSKGYYYVHPANEPYLINGVGTEFIEIINELPDVDAVILPLGGGSEVASAIVALNMLKPQVEIYAMQAEFSCAAYRKAPLTVISLSKGLLSPTLNGLPPGPVKRGFTIFFRAVCPAS